MIISSVDNKTIKDIKKLKNNKFIYSEKKFLIEGDHLIKEALKAKLLDAVIKLEGNHESYGVEEIIVTSNVMRSLSNLSSLPQCLGVCKLIPEKENIGDKIIILDGVQDPGNLGTIIRSAKAFNFDTVVLSDNSVSKYNDKVIRATQGMLFNTNVITRKLSKFIPELKFDGYVLYGTSVVNGEPLKKLLHDKKIAVVMGSEGSGISNEVKGLVDKNIYINMNKGCESLNVAVAASIIMHKLGE